MKPKQIITTMLLSMMLFVTTMKYNVRGDLDGLLDYLRSLIPNFFEIVDG